MLLMMIALPRYATAVFLPRRALRHADAMLLPPFLRHDVSLPPLFIIAAAMLLF